MDDVPGIIAATIVFIVIGTLGGFLFTSAVLLAVRLFGVF